MADPATPPVASAPVGTLPPKPLSQEDLINQQFQAAQGNLLRQRNAGQDQLNTGLARQQAIGGLSGGAITKATQLGEVGLENTTQQNQAGLDAQKAQALQQVAATKQAQEYATGERLGSQQFASEESGKQRELQQEEFNKTYGLQQQQFNASIDQFNQQMQFQKVQFGADQYTNMINALTALDKSGASDSNRWAQLEHILGQSASAFQENAFSPGYTNLLLGSGPQYKSPYPTTA